VGELKGFRRLKTICLSSEVRDNEFAHRSPAAADGNELNMSGCLGAGVSLQQVLGAWITKQYGRRTRSTDVAVLPPQIFSSRGRMSTEMKANQSLLSSKTGISGEIDVVGVMVV
jgi:hypothetical protein